MCLAQEILPYLHPQFLQNHIIDQAVPSAVSGTSVKPRSAPLTTAEGLSLIPEGLLPSRPLLISLLAVLLAVPPRGGALRREGPRQGQPRQQQPRCDDAVVQQERRVQRHVVRPARRENGPGLTVLALVIDVTVEIDSGRVGESKAQDDEEAERPTVRYSGHGVTDCGVEQGLGLESATLCALWKSQRFRVY